MAGLNNYPFPSKYIVDRQFFTKEKFFKGDFRYEDLLILKGDAVECQIRIVSQIGHPINDPWMGDIELIAAPNVNFDATAAKAKEILQAELDGYLKLREDLYAGKVKVW